MVIQKGPHVAIQYHQDFTKMKTEHRFDVKKDTSAKEKPRGVLHVKLDRTLKNQAPLIALIVLPDTLLKTKQQRAVNPALLVGCVERQTMERSAFNAKLERRQYGKVLPRGKYFLLVVLRAPPLACSFLFLFSLFLTIDMWPHILFLFISIVLLPFI